MWRLRDLGVRAHRTPRPEGPGPMGGGLGDLLSVAAARPGPVVVMALPVQNEWSALLDDEAGPEYLAAREPSPVAPLPLRGDNGRRRSRSLALILPHFPSPGGLVCARRVLRRPACHHSQVAGSQPRLPVFDSRCGAGPPSTECPRARDLCSRRRLGAQPARAWPRCTLSNTEALKKAWLQRRSGRSKARNPLHAVGPSATGAQSAASPVDRQEQPRSVVDQAESGQTHTSCQQPHIGDLVRVFSAYDKVDHARRCASILSHRGVTLYCGYLNRYHRATPGYWSGATPHASSVTTCPTG
eukprot:scaffold1658_cov393-Prasinococcus_capsulatus_cf.AAC.17